jgi:hypothetical protein
MPSFIDSFALVLTVAKLGNGGPPMQNPDRSDVKSSARDAIERLPDDATWDDVMYRIYVRQKIESGIGDVENGDTLTTEEVRKRFGISNEG